MLWQISAWAFALDQWLKEHIGRPYTIILGSSLRQDPGRYKAT